MKAAKILLKILLTALIGLFVIWMAVFIVIRTEKGHEWALNQLIHTLTPNIDTEVHISHVELALPLGLRLHHIAIYDKGSLLASAEELECRCSFASLLRGRLVFASLHAKTVNISKNILDLFPTNSNVKSDRGPIDWNLPLPIDFKVRNLFVEDLHIDPFLIDSWTTEQPQLAAILKASTFQLQGFVNNNLKKRAFAAHLLATATPEDNTHPTLQLGIDTQNQLLSLSIHANGLSSTYLPLESRADIACSATAPIAVWSSLHLDPASIEGSFKVIVTTRDEKTEVKGRYQTEQSHSIRFYDATLHNPSPLIPSLPNQLQLSDLTLNGLIQDYKTEPTLSIQVISPKISIQGHDLDNLNTTLSACIKDQKWECLMAISTLFNGIPCDMKGSLVLNEGQLINVSNLSLETSKSRFEAKGSYSIPNKIFEGSLEGHSKDLQDLAFLFPDADAPKGEGDLKLLIDRDPLNPLGQKINCELHWQNPQWRDWKAAHFTAQTELTEMNIGDYPSMKVAGMLQFDQLNGPDLSVKKLELKIDQMLTPDLSNLDEISFELRGESLRAGSFETNNLALAAFIQEPFNSNGGRFQLKGSTTLKDKLDLSLKGTWIVKDQTNFTAQVENGTGQFGPYAIQFFKPFQLQVSPNDFSLSSLHMMLGEGEFQSDLTWKDERLECQFQGTQIPSELLHFVAPNAPLAGRVSFTANLEGPLEGPQGHVGITLHDMLIAEQIFANQPSIKGDIICELGDVGIHVQGELSGIGNHPFTVEGILPVSLSLSPANMVLHEKTPFHLTLLAEGEMDPYLHLFYNDTSNITGDAKIALEITGSLANPEITGGVDFQNGTYESFDTGAIYRNISARVEGDGSKLLLKNFIAHDKAQGNIKASGTLTLDAANQFPFEFDIEPTHIAIIDADYATILGSGVLKLTGNTQQGRLEGKLTIDNAAVRLEEALPSQIKSVDVKHVNLPEGMEKHQYSDSNVGWPVQLNVAMDFPGKVNIQGKNLTSEWKGAIAATGTLDTPLLYGELRIVSGEYDFNGKAFTISQGNIHFAGLPSKKTTLYAVASKDMDRIIAEIIVKGPVNHLAISFRSNPPLSQREVLSYILFNRGISDISSNQGDQLTQSFVDLNTASEGQSDFLSKLRNNIGIDRLDFTSDGTEDGDMSLQVGKYISENVMISVNKGINAADDRISLEAKLRKNLKAQAEMGVGEESQNKLILKWKKDY